ncbi:MAG: universal stress protein UspA related nucleotide-binding protein [uncultured archaeon A07HR60]|nr:MAG: universal stress protein UspA related nucleotide-binding protein [uncultured archaeon A07HR60]
MDTQLYRAASPDTQDEILTRLRDTGETALEQLRKEADEDGFDVETTILEGRPDDEIAAHADEADIDVIVMGTHGRTGRDRLAKLGSVAERLLTATDVPMFRCSS